MNNTNLRPIASTNSPIDGLAIAGFALGTLSLLVSFVPICGGAFALGSLTLSLIGRSSPRYRRLASWGASFSVIALAISVAVLLGYGPWRFVAPYQHTHFDF